MLFKLSLKSKNVNSLKNFIFTLNSIENILNEKSLKIKPIKKLKKVLFSILKSPHVNKTSQEQFDYVYYSSEILIFTNNYLKVLLLLKLLSNKFFSSINMKVTVISGYKDSLTYDLMSYKNFQYKELNSSYFQFLDIIGEIKSF